MSFTIRRLRKEEIPEVIEKIEAYLKDEAHPNYYKDIDIDKEKLYKIVSSRLNDPLFFACVIISDNEIVGGMCAEIAAPIFSSDLIAFDQIIYTLPRYNVVKAILKLILHYHQWAKDRGAVEARLCTASGYKAEKFAKLAERCGFTQFEVGFSRRLV